MKVTVCTQREILSPCGLPNFDYQVDPYIGCEHLCHYCYAMAEAETDWSKEIRIHSDIVEQLSIALENIPPQTIYLGYHTDPYQPCEAQHRQTRKVLELLLQKGFSARILTKSDLVVRDLDILQGMNEAGVSVSVAFNDNRTRKLFEANTVATERRVEAIRQVKEAGIRTGAMLCPVIPHITDATALIDMLEPYAEIIRIYGLSILDRTDRSWMAVKPILADHFPDVMAQVEDAIFSKEHAYWHQLRDELVALKNERQLNLDIHL